MIDGPILTLDLASETGWAHGHPRDAKPESGSEKMKGKGEDNDDLMGNMIAFLDEKIRIVKPKLIVREAPMPLAAFKGKKHSEAARKIAWGLDAIAGGMGKRYGVEPVVVYPATVRAFFIGQSNFGKRKDTKNEVVARCHLLRLMPKDSWNDNRADSIAMWFWAASHYGNRHADKLFFFGERAK